MLRYLETELFVPPCLRVLFLLLLLLGLCLLLLLMCLPLPLFLLQVLGFGSAKQKP